MHVRYARCSARLETTYCAALLRLGFVRGTANPCLFTHKSRNIRLCVHGDDFLSVAKLADTKWFEEALFKEFERKVKGNLQKPKDEFRVLNRIIRRIEAGYEMESDQRHAEIIVRDLGFTEESKALSAPGRKPTKAELDGERESLSPEDHSDYVPRTCGQVHTRENGQSRAAQRRRGGNKAHQRICPE